MTERADAPEVEPWVAQLGEMVDGGRHVIERGRPATALPASKPAVLDVPHRNPAAGEVHRHELLQPLAVARTPVAAMDGHRHGELAVAARQVQIGALAAMRAVAVTLGPGEKEVADQLGGARDGGTVGAAGA